ncbi:hypothetical protein KO561_01590 [Radiobacillus kanasensis]|uniref:hypothetical protein n=1 Tax=Radiobacillus kanasensis TaxID=2844358 RepID=UPI001E313439|nr:hypothetical protein [Radiobacillus kanasensis]UFT99693.1 hypothetical protein KO561_01590 [Radiobacillus kanasensis]
MDYHKKKQRLKGEKKLFIKKMIPFVFFLAFLANTPYQVAYSDASYHPVAVSSEGIEQAEVTDWHLDVHPDQKGNAVFGSTLTFISLILVILSVFVQPDRSIWRRFLTPIYYQSSYLIDHR